MDVDLSTDLDALLPLVAPLVSGHSDVAIGTRLAPTARVVRGPKRELISRTYNLILKTALHSHFSDAQCGFKAARTEVARTLLPLVEDEGWFFDTELLVVAELNGLRIHEVPVDWVDDPDSRVDVVTTAKTDLLGVGRMLRGMVTGRVWLPAGLAQGGPDATGSAARQPVQGAARAQLSRFASVGAVSTLVFAALVAVLAAPVGLLLADVVALAICSVANTAANRRLTFSLSGRARRTRHYSRGLAVAVLPFALTLFGLAALAVAGVSALAVQVLVLTLASATAAVVRFVALRHWVFEP